MSSPAEERKTFLVKDDERQVHQDSVSSDEKTFIHEGSSDPATDKLQVDTSYQGIDAESESMRTPSARREQATRLEDDLLLLQAERVASRSTQGPEEGDNTSLSRSRSRRTERVDEFDEATNPLYEKAATYTPPEKPNTKLAVFVKRIHQSSFIVRYVTYIAPLVLILLIPLLVGALAYPDASVGGVELMWFSIWLEIVWLTLWAGRLCSKILPIVFGILASIFTNNAKKWRDVGKQLEIPAALFFWWLGVEISFLPTMKNHHVDGDHRTRGWEGTVNKLIICVFVFTILNFIEKIIIQLIAMSFHMRTYADRIEINKFQIGSLTKLYAWSRSRIEETDEAFEEKEEDGTPGGAKTPLGNNVNKAQRIAKATVSKAVNKVSDAAGAVAADFTGQAAKSSSDPHQVILALLRSTTGCQTLARRLYRTFVRDGFDTVFSGDLKEAFSDGEEAEAAFAMFDRDMNGDISMDELEAVCVDIGRERKSITASLKDLDSVVGKLGSVFMFFICVIVIIVFLSLISTSAAGVLTSAGSSILALSWLFSATAQEFLQSVIFVFVKHPFDVGDRVTIYGNSGDAGLGDDYFVKEITLLYTEFKKMQGHVVQAPNSYLNGLFILNQRRSGALAEAIPIIIKYGTTIDQIDGLRQRLLEFVRSEKRDFQTNILTELRAVTENFSLTLNVVFFYKSNWQNEGLRLQRRNKFICMMMIALQEIGIEGPRMNLSGYGHDIPIHVSYQNAPMLAPNRADEDRRGEAVPIGEAPQGLGENTGVSTGNVGRQPSILRKGMNTASARARGASVSRKHVDFSLGMSGISSGDVMGDVFDDNPTSRMNSLMQAEKEREAQEKRMQEIAEEEEERRSRTSASSRQRSAVASPVPESGRESVDASSFRSGGSTSQRNRFFRSRGSLSRDRADVEQGRRAGSPPPPPPPAAQP